MFFNIFISSSVVIIFGFYWFYRRAWSFWSDRNIPFLKPEFPAGNINEVIKAESHFGVAMEKIYNEMKTKSDYCGIYTFSEKSLLVLSPEFAKTVLVRDFNVFMNRGIYFNERDDPMSAHLFFIAGQKWKDLRAKIIPTFTSAKLKRMFHTIFEVGNRFVDHLITLSEKSNEIEIYDLLARFNTDVVGSCAFGFESNSLKEPDNEFRTMGRKMLSFGRFKMLRLFFAMSFQKTAKFLGIKFNDTDVADFFMSVVRETIEHREKTGNTRNDFMQLLIELMNRNENEDRLTFNEVAAQAFVFYFAGFETSSTVTCFTLHSLAFHEEIQDQARQTIRNVLNKYNNEWCYEAIMEMTYLDQIIDESMRLNPPVATLHRQLSCDYKLDNGAILPKGLQVVIPVLGFHHDKDIFPNPHIFNPERFSQEEKQKRHAFSFIPFGEGPRYCIGMRFGVLQTKLAVAMILHNFRITPSHRSVNPIEINPVTLIHGPKGDVWLNFHKIGDEEH